MSRQREDPMQRAVRAFRELSADQQSTFLLAVALAGNLQAEPATRKRAPKAPKEEVKP